MSSRPNRRRSSRAHQQEKRAQRFLKRREGPVPKRKVVSPEVVPLDTSLPDVCVRQKMCLALHVQSEGGMGWIVTALVFQWGVMATCVAVVILVHGLSESRFMLAVMLLPLLLSLVVYRRNGHRGWCWILRSQRLEALVFIPRLFLAWVLRPFRRIRRLLNGIWRFLAELGGF